MEYQQSVATPARFFTFLHAVLRLVTGALGPTGVVCHVLVFQLTQETRTIQADATDGTTGLRRDGSESVAPLMC